jgi:hypothetical protein
VNAQRPGRLSRAHLVPHCVFPTRNSARTDPFFYLEAFYNRRRRHSALNIPTRMPMSNSTRSEVIVDSLRAHGMRGGL